MYIYCIFNVYNYKKYLYNYLEICLIYFLYIFMKNTYKNKIVSIYCGWLKDK